MDFVRNYLFAFLLAVSIFCIFAGIFSGDHEMLLSYSIVICLNCMGIG